MYHRLIAAISASAAAFAFVTPAAIAGLSGQLPVTGDARAKIQTESANILKGDIATGRPNLMLAVEAVAAKDFTDLVARVVGDDTTYAGLVGTVQDAIKDSKSADQQNYLIYNLVRLHYLRSLLIANSFERGGPLAAAAAAARRFPSDLADPKAWELKGDVYTEVGDLEKSLAAFHQMEAVGAPSALVQYKIGYAYERANRRSLALNAYQTALRADIGSSAGGPEFRHLLYQGLTRLALADGNNRVALTYLAKSAVGGDSDAPFTYRVDAARQLLLRGYVRQVLAYAKSALAAAPDDPAAAALRDDAVRLLPRQVSP